MPIRFHIAFLAAFAALAVPAAGERHGEPAAGGGQLIAESSVQPGGPGPETSRLGGEIKRLKREIADLERLAVWQRELLRAASSDPATALRQRRPMADCLASALAPLCDRLTSMFAEPPPSAGDGLTPDTGEGPK